MGERAWGLEGKAWLFSLVMRARQSGAGERAGENVFETCNTLWSEGCTQVVFEGIRGPTITSTCSLACGMFLYLPLGEHALETKKKKKKRLKKPAPASSFHLPWRFAAAWALSLLNPHIPPTP